MSKDYERCPVFFITNDDKLYCVWMANPHGDPILMLAVDKSLRRITHIKDLPEEKAEHVSKAGAKLDALISHGLASASTSPSPWTQFLTQGLYDPRLFAFFIRPFLTESNKPPAA